MRLFGSELTRLRSRRLFRWVLLLFAGCIVLAAVLLLVDGAFYRSDLEGAMIGLAFPLVMFGWLVGASAIGAEWSHRTVTALLTWEPRRTRVLATKALAAATFTAILVAFLQAFFTGMLFVAAESAGPPLDWGEYWGVSARILLVSVIASVLGFGLATIGKNTGAALGGGMAYLLVIESLVRGFKPSWSDWLLGSNFGRVIEGGVGSGIANRSTAGAAVVLVVYAGGLFLVALWFFRRREIA